ncbi:MAG: iron chaperone, partial [Candidatus Limnocylindrus sp.]
RGSNPLSSTSPLSVQEVHVAATWPRHSAASVDAYSDALPAPEAKSLHRLRDAILAAAPGGTEEISYRVPAVKFPNGGRTRFGARRGGLSLYAGYAFQLFTKELADFAVVGTTIHFTADHQLPIALIKRITRATIAQQDERLAARSKKKAR